jgi:hypothetical protein
MQMEMSDMSEKFDVEYLVNGRAEKLVVKGADFMAAAKTATERLVVLHSRTDDRHLTTTTEAPSILWRRSAAASRQLSTTRGAHQKSGVPTPGNVSTWI